MSNIKKVDIVGVGEWPIGSSSNQHGDKESKRLLQEMIGSIALNPIIGLKVKVRHHVDEVYPNQFGGTTFIDMLSITGSEAVRWDWLCKLVRTMYEAGVSIIVARAMDIEFDPENAVWTDIIDPDTLDEYDFSLSKEEA